MGAQFPKITQAQVTGAPTQANPTNADIQLVAQLEAIAHSTSGEAPQLPIDVTTAYVHNTWARMHGLPSGLRRAKASARMIQEVLS